MTEDRVDLVGYETKTVVLNKDLEGIILHNVRTACMIQVSLRREDEQDDIFIEKMMLADLVESQSKILIDVERQNVPLLVAHAVDTKAAPETHEVFANAYLRLTKGGEWKLRDDDQIIIVFTDLGKIAADCFIEPLEGFGVATSLVRYRKFNFNLAKGIKALPVDEVKYLVFNSNDSKIPDTIEMWNKSKQRKTISRDNLRSLNVINYGVSVVEQENGETDIMDFGSYNCLLLDVKDLQLLNLSDGTNNADYDFYAFY